MQHLKLDSQGRRKVKYCPCGKDNRDGKFIPFTGHTDYGYCHACDQSFFPPMEKVEKLRHATSRKPEKRQELPISIISNHLVKSNVIDPSSSNLIKWLGCESRRSRDEVPFTREQVNNVIKLYRIRGSSVYSGGVAFIYIDIKGRVRQIKVMGYNPETGKRVKTPFPEVTQIGKQLLHNVQVSDINLVPCFFGEHLLAENNKDVYVFESEATAIYASAFFNDKVCIATGGKHGCQWDKQGHYEVLRGRKVILWPDVDAREEWIVKAEVLRKAGIDVTVSKVITNAVQKQVQITGVSWDEYKALKFDLRDILVFKQPLLLPDSKGVSKVKIDIDHEPNVSDNITSDLTQGCLIELEKGAVAKAFDVEEYKTWVNTVEPLRSPIYIEKDLTVYDLTAFVTGRLNHIRAFTNYREPGNKQMFIHQLQQLRRCLS